MRTPNALLTAPRIAPRLTTRVAALLAVAATSAATAQTFDTKLAGPAVPDPTGMRMGVAVCGLGDLDGDARKEYAVASVRGDWTVSDPPTDPVIRIFGGATGEVLFALKPAATHATYLRLAALGDLDGDGVGELLVGAPDEGDGQIEIFSLGTGELFRTQTSPTASARYGAAVANLGDIDGDGTDDYGVGAPRDGGHDHGAVYVFSGLAGNLIEKRVGNASALGFGAAVATIGDIQLDGDLDIAASGLGNFIQEPEVWLFTPTSAFFLRMHTTGADSHRYGSSILRVGDVESDGIDDYAVGDPDAGTSGTPPFGADKPFRGKVHVYSGGTGGQLYSVYGSHPNEFIGGRMSSVQDVNLDGVDEILAAGTHSAELLSGATGGLLHEYGYGPGNPFDPVADDAYLAVADIGDLSGVGTREFVIGSQFFDGTANNSGIAVVRSYGEAVPFASHQPGERSGFGDAVLAHPDVNGDGYGDSIVAARHDDSGDVDGGSVRAISGQDGSLIWLRRGTFGEQLGASLALLGDLDGDGVGDVAAGAPQAWVFAGLLGWQRRGKVELLSGATGLLIRDLNGNDTGERFGDAVASTDDADGDGLADVIIGAPHHDAIGGLVQRAGQVTLVSSGTGLDLGQWAGTFPEQRLGAAVAGPGDVNGDGAGDVAYLSPGTEKLTVRSGGTGVWLWDTTDIGVETLAAVGDLDGDGVCDLATASPMGVGVVDYHSGADGTWLDADLGGALADIFGASIASAGDVDLNGELDVAIGSPGVDDVWPLFLFEVGAVDVVLNPTTSATRRTWTGLAEYGRLGAGVASAVDFNRDGIPDVVAGEPGYADEAGSAWTLSSRALGTEPYGSGTQACAGKQRLVASAPAEPAKLLTLRGTNAPPGAPSFLAISLGQDLPGTDYGFGFQTHINLLTILLSTSTAADPAGTAAFPLPIPDDAGLVGLEVFAQVVFVGTPGACGLPLGLSSSEGLSIEVQE